MRIVSSDQSRLVREFYNMLFEERCPRTVFNQVIHEDFELEDQPVNVKVAGKEAFWSAVNVPVEDKRTLCFDSEFIEYVGKQDEGYARWRFRPAAGYAAALWGLVDVAEFDIAEAPEIEVVARVKFRDNKIQSIRETWDPSALLRKVGVNMPVTGAA